MDKMFSLCRQLLSRICPICINHEINTFIATYVESKNLKQKAFILKTYKASAKRLITMNRYELLSVIVKPGVEKRYFFFASFRFVSEKYLFRFGFRFRFQKKYSFVSFLEK
jgi:hypothetical protein